MTLLRGDRRPGPDRQELVRLLPALGVLLVWVALMPAAGGFAPRDWLPAGMVLAGLLMMAVVGGGALLPHARYARWTVLALAAYTAWSALSITWTQAPGDAWEATNLLLVTLLSGWVLALVPWRPRTVEIGMLVFCVAAAVVCAITLVGALRTSDLEPLFTGLRFNQPLDYPNTSAAFCVIAAIPGLLLAARPGGGPALKALGLAAATFLIAFGLLPQSRGSVIGAVFAVLVMLAVVPFRWRLLGALLVTAIGTGLALGPVLEVYDQASTGGDTSGALVSAAWSLLAATGVGAVGGALLSLIERRVSPGDDARVWIRRAGFGAIGLVVVLLVSAAAVNSGRIKGAVDDQLNSLRNPGVEFSGGIANPAGQNRLLAADPLERYDYWRVALDGLRDHPIGGLGAGGFDHTYTQERRYPKPSKYAHFLVLRVAGDTGVVGLLLFTAFVLAIAGGLLRGLRDAGRGERAISAAALATVAYVAVHSSLDWLEVYPVITGPVLGISVMALVARDRDERLAQLAGDRPAPASKRRLPRLPALPVPAAIGGAAVLALVVILSMAFPWVSLRYEEQATANWRADPAGAYQGLRRAIDLNPLSDAAATDLGLIAVQRGDTRTAREAFRTALSREQSWLPHAQLAFLAREAGDREEATRQLDRAVELSPKEVTLVTARKLIDAKGRLNAAEATRRMFEQETSTSPRLS